MAPRILALKIKGQRDIDAIQGDLYQYRQEIGHYDLLTIPETGYTLLRLSHVDAVIVARDDYSDYPQELAEVCAWIRGLKRRAPAAKIPIAVNPCQAQRVGCEISSVSTAQKSCYNQLTACLQKVTAISDAREENLGSRGATQSDLVVLESLVVEAVRAGWTTPDGKIGPKQPLSMTLEDTVREWVHRRPALACASAADAMGWLAHRATSGAGASHTRIAKLPALSDGDQVVSCALAWALESTTAAADRYKALAASRWRRIAIVWHGANGPQFRLALRALLLDQIGYDAKIPHDPPGSWEALLGVPDTVAGRRAPSTLAPDPNHVSPMNDVPRTETEHVLDAQPDIVAFGVAEQDLEFVMSVAPKYRHECIVLSQRDLGELLDKTAAAANSLVDRTGHK